MAKTKEIIEIKEIKNLYKMPKIKYNIIVYYK